MMDNITAIDEPAFHNIICKESSKVSDMSIIIYGGAAGVETNYTRFNSGEFLLLTSKCVVELELVSVRCPESSRLYIRRGRSSGGSSESPASHLGRPVLYMIAMLAAKETPISS